MAKNKGGRPAIDFDAKEVEKLGSIGATIEEMAGWFDVTTRTIERRLADEEGEFCRVYKRGRSRVKMSLRRKQIDLANDGNPTMLIWLGKQLLEQRDNRDSMNINLESKGGVLLVPMTQDLDEWESNSIAQQEKLQQDTIDI